MSGLRWCNVKRLLKLIYAHPSGHNVLYRYYKLHKKKEKLEKKKTVNNCEATATRLSDFVLPYNILLLYYYYTTTNLTRWPN